MYTMAHFMALSPSMAVTRKLGLLRGRRSGKIRSVGNRVAALPSSPAPIAKPPMLSPDSGMPIRQPMLPTVKRR